MAFRYVVTFNYGMCLQRATSIKIVGVWAEAMCVLILTDSTHPVTQACGSEYFLLTPCFLSSGLAVTLNNSSL